MNDTDKKNNEQKIISSLVRDFIIYIDQECFKSPEDFNPFVDLVVPTLRKYNQKLNVNCDYIKHVRKVLANEKNLKNNLDILQRSGRLSIVDCDSVGDLISSHHSDGNTLFITQNYDQATSIKNNEDTFDSNNLFIKCINLEASLDYFKGIRNKYASLGNSPAEAAKMDSIIIDMSSLFFENTSFFLDDLNLFNNPSFKYKFYICKTDLDKFYNEVKISHFADSSYSRLDREFGAITFNPHLEGKDDSATVRKFRTEKNVGVLTFSDSRASEFYNMNEPDLSGRWVCPFKIKDGDACTDYPSSPWKNDINSLFAKVKDFLNSNEDSFAKYAELSKARTAASIEEDEKKKQIERAPAKPAEEKKPVADPIIKVNNSDFSDLVVESDATKNNEMMFAKSKDFAKAVVQPKSQDVVAPLATSSVKASTINPEVASTDDSVIRQVNQNNNLQFVKSDEKKPSIADRVQQPAQIGKKIETPVTQEKKTEPAVTGTKTTVSVVGAAKSVADSVSVEKIVPQEDTKVESFDSVFTGAKTEQIVKPEVSAPEKQPVQAAQKVEVKPEVKADAKPEAKPEVKVDAKVENKSEEKIVEKVEVKPEEKIVEKVEEKPEEKIVEKVEVKPEEKIVEKVEVKPEEKIVEKVEEKPVEKTAEKVEEKPVEKTAEKVEEKPEEKIVEKVEAKPVVKEEKKHRGFFGFSLFGRKKNKAEENAKEVKTESKEVVEPVKNDVTEKVEAVQKTVEAKVEEIKSDISEKAEAVKADVAEKVVEVKTLVAEKAVEAKTAVTEKVEAVKAETAEKVADAKAKVDEAKTAVADKAAEVKASLTEKIEEVKTDVAEKAEESKSVDPVIGVANGASESAEDAIKAQKSIKESIAGIVGDTDILNDNDEHNKKVKFMSSGLGFNFTKKHESKNDSPAEHDSSEHEAKAVKFVSSGSNYKFTFKKKHDDSVASEEHSDTHAGEHAKYSFVSSGSNFMFTVKKKAEDTEEKKAEAAPAKAEEKKAEAAPAKVEEKKAETISSDDKKLLNLSHETTRIALDSGTAVSSDVPAKPSVKKSSFDSKGASVSLADAVKIHDGAQAPQNVKTNDSGITASDVLKNVSVDDKMNIVNDFNRFRVSDIADSIIDSSNRAEKADTDTGSTGESIIAGSSTSYKDAVSTLARKTKAENSVMVGSASSMAERTEEIKKSFAKTVELASEKVKSEAESAVRRADVTSIDSGRNNAQDLIKKLNPVKMSKEEYAAKGKSIVNEMLSSIDQVKSNTSFGESDAIRDEDKTPAALQLKPSAAGFNLTGKELEKIQKEREAEEKARLAQEAKQREEDIALGKIKVPHVTQNYKLDKTTGGFNVTSEKAEELQERHRINNIGLVEALKAEKARQEKDAADYARDVNTVKAIEEYELEGENADYVYVKSSKNKDETPVEDFDMNEKRKEMLRNYEASQRSEVSIRRNLESANFYNANDKRKSRYGNAVNSAGQTARKVADVRGFDSSLFSDRPKTSSVQKTNPERSTQDYARVNQMIEERTRELESRKPEAALQQTQTRTDATSTQSQTVDIVISSQDGVKAGAVKEVAAVRTEASSVEESIDVKQVSEDRSVVSSKDNSAQAPFARTGNPYQVTVGLGIVEIPKLNDSVFINGAEVKLTNPIIMSQSLAIYANEKDPETIIKIFGRNSLNASMIAKLETMMENQVNIDGIEWPRALIKNAAGDIVGCVMRKINTTSLQVMCNSREYYFHGYNRIDLVKMALDYLNKVAKLHELNIFLGVEDLNAIAIDAYKKVSFLNLERMQIGDYPYLPVLNAVTAPELSSELSANMAGEISDRYVVAYTLFKLLFLGRSPYVTSHLQGVPVDKLTAFRFPENVFDPMVPPKDEAFYIWSYLPQYIKEAFISSLSTGYHESDRRKTVNEWLVLMNKFLAEITNPAVAPMALELSPSRAASADSSTSVECKLCRSAVSKIDASVTDGFCHHCFNQRGRLAKCSCCGKTFLVSYRDIKVGGDDSPKFCQSCKTKFMHTKTISKCHECNRSYVVTEGDELMYGSEIYSRCQDCLKAERDKKKEAEAKVDSMITKK